MAIARVKEREGKGRWCLMGVDFQAGKMKKVLDVGADAGDGCTTV